MNKQPTSILVVSKVPQYFIEMLTEAGFRIDYRPDSTKREIQRVVDRFKGLIFRSDFSVDIELLDKATKLEFIARIGSGMERVDLDAAQERNIRVYRSPEGNADAVAEHTIGMILSLFNKLNECDRMVRTHDAWDRSAMTGERLEGKNIGIIGFGYVGKALFRRLACWGVNRLVYDVNIPPFHHPDILERIKKEADIVSFHVPLTASTKAFLDKNFIQSMRRPFYLVNTSRGGVVRTEDALWGLDNKMILGACLDVFEIEEEGNNSKKDLECMQRLRERTDVILSPHVAGWNHYSKKALHDVLFKKIVEHEKN